MHLPAGAFSPTNLLLLSGGAALLGPALPICGRSPPRGRPAGPLRGLVAAALVLSSPLLALTGAWSAEHASGQANAPSLYAYGALVNPRHQGERAGWTDRGSRVS